MSCVSCVLREDEYDFETHTFQSYYRLGGLLLTSKKSRLISAVAQNQLEVLMDLLDSPKWYNVCHKSGYSLLQIAILRNNKEVFDYMLSIPDFPLEFVNNVGQTAFIVSLEGYPWGGFLDEHFAYELIKKGICIKVDEHVLRDRIVTSGRTRTKQHYGGFYPLHRAVERSFAKVSKLIIESGIDVNMSDYDGHTPLELASYKFSGEDRWEIISALLVHGAVPTVDLFESSVITRMDHGFQENLFLYVCDHHTTSLELEIDTLLKLIETKSGLIEEIIKYPVKIKPNSGFFFTILCSMSAENLKITLDKFNDSLCQAFSSADFDRKWFWFFKHISLENLDLMLESNLGSYVKHFILTMDRFFWLEKSYVSVWDCKTAMTELYYYLLSHDLITIHSRYLDFIFSELDGWCELFKFLLHMDIRLEPDMYRWFNIMSVFSSDVTMDLDKFLKTPQYYDIHFYPGNNNVREVVKYFAHPKLKEICQHRFGRHKFVLPELPSLLELARNSFRKYFIQRFNITTCKQFYYLMDCLLISPVHKKIITYETELYPLTVKSEDL